MGGNVTHRRTLQLFVVGLGFLGVVGIRYFGSAEHLHVWPHVLTAGWIAVCALAFPKRSRNMQSDQDVRLQECPALLKFGPDPEGVRNKPGCEPLV